jgi:long-subunit acyl-CoA synthetase (AMP-forming)
MNIDPRLIEIDLADHEEPVDTMRAQLGVIADNLMSGYLHDPARTDAILRRDGMTKTADRLVELFGPEWWTRTNS